ncbi:hypothetical protein PHYPO_G00066640 [Pangasianodon hypophthalmus]|uniref:Uncharacterized protein n=1 Tax=Pangasianodon hypophthalmus TaxID=310915 RepID=A0A5N5M2Q7_PANHP|nr:hypothetical protein PHYPO_G00066640 [Pangasianodon hypophthalmus]
MFRFPCRLKYLMASPPEPDSTTDHFNSVTSDSETGTVAFTEEPEEPLLVFVDRATHTVVFKQEPAEPLSVDTDSSGSEFEGLPRYAPRPGQRRRLFYSREFIPFNTCSEKKPRASGGGQTSPSDNREYKKSAEEAGFPLRRSYLICIGPPPPVCKESQKKCTVPSLCMSHSKCPPTSYKPP